MTESDDAYDFEKEMKSVLYRFDCPSPFELGNYHSGLLSENDVHTITSHIDKCPYCREELEDLEEFLTHEIPPDKPGIETLEVVGKIIPFVRNEVCYETPEIKSALREGTGTPVDSRKIKIKYKENETIEMFYQIVYKDNTYSLRGQFALPEILEKMIINSLIEIWQNNTIIAARHIDDLCSFQCILENTEPVFIRISNEAGTFLSFQLRVTP